ncbi:MAG: ogr/Delta-like zinc finger family protein [Candidatus Thermoplasmatota archaeon]
MMMCPYCGEGARYKNTRRIRQGRKARYYVCQGCGAQIRALLNPLPKEMEDEG